MYVYIYIYYKHLIFNVTTSLSTGLKKKVKYYFQVDQKIINNLSKRSPPQWEKDSFVLLRN